MDTGMFAHRIRQAALLTNEESRGVRLAFEPGKVTLTSRAPETGEAEVTMDVAFEGDAMDLAFNPVFLTDALKVMTAGETTLEFSAPNKPAVLKCGAEFLYVVMPVDLG